LRRVEDGLSKLGIGAGQRDEQGDLRRPARGRWPPRGRSAGHDRRRRRKAPVKGRLRVGDRGRYLPVRAGSQRDNSEDDEM
jgi:hypothetical protein